MRSMALKQGWYRAQNNVCYPETSKLSYRDGLKTLIKMVKAKNLQIFQPDG